MLPDLVVLRKQAEAAAQSTNWRVSDGAWGALRVISNVGVVRVTVATVKDRFVAAYIAAASPDTLLALIDGIDRVRALHQPTEEEAELWWEQDGHDERFPDCPGQDCEGHMFTIRVCNECGYEHDGETPIYRGWPCPTVAALGVEGQ